MFEGHDTTSASMSCVLQSLCNWPEVLKKLQDEVDGAFDRGLSFEEGNANQVKMTLMSLPYLEAVIKESLRMYPSVPMFGRSLSEDVEINGHLISEGTLTTVMPYAIHHDPEVYKDPLTFNPDRWINNEVPIEENPYCYIPFSAGPRNCIGQKFA